MIQLTLIEKQVENNPIFSRKFEVKKGHKTFAKIFTRKNGETSVEINGCQWIKNNLTDAIDHVKEMAGLLFFDQINYIKM
jgi:hypothetical protein